MWCIKDISDEVTTCECCGKSNLKLTVVLSNGEGEVFYGRDCAARKLLGNNKSGSVKLVERKAQAAVLARKWLSNGHSAEVVAKGIWNRFGFLTSAKGTAVDIDGVGIIAI